MSKIWTKEEEEYIKNKWLSNTDKELSISLKRGIHSVTNKRRRMGLTIEGELLKKRTRVAAYSTHKKRSSKTVNRYKKSSMYSIVYLANAERLSKQIRPKPHSFESILQDICEIFNLPAEGVKSRKRNDEYVWCRQIFCYVSRKLRPRITLNNIGKFVGFKDHTDPLYAIKRVREGIKLQDPVFLEKWNYYLSKTEIYKR